MNIEKRIKNKVNQAIKKYNMFTRKEKVLVAVSGGKDSLSLIVVLKELNFNIECLFIDLGFKKFSQLSLSKIEKITTHYKIPLHIVKAKELVGVTIPQAVVKYPQNACAVCGSIKRKIYNSFAKEGGFHILVTGHHLDDEAANLLADNLRWDWGYMKKAQPLLNEKYGFIKRGKPFCFVREKESRAYALLKNIDFIHETCPYEKNASRRKYEKILSKMDEVFPNMVEQYYKNYLKKYHSFKVFPEEMLILNPCQICGDLTTHHTCRVCLIKQKKWKR